MDEITKVPKSWSLDDGGNLIPLDIGALSSSSIFTSSNSTLTITSDTVEGQTMNVLEVRPSW